MKTFAFLSPQLLIAISPAVAGIACAVEVPAPTHEEGAVGDAALPRVTEGFAGRVVDEFGQPVQGALIVPTSLQRPGPPIPELAVLSGHDGRFVWALPAGIYEVLVTAERYRSVKLRVNVPNGTVALVDVVLNQER